MNPFDKCPVCGGELLEKEVEKLLKGGRDVAVVKVKALVCTECGERIYPIEVVRKFEEIRERLKRRDTKGFVPIGTAFRAEI